MPAAIEEARNAVWAEATAIIHDLQAQVCAQNLCSVSPNGDRHDCPICIASAQHTCLWIALSLHADNLTAGVTVDRIQTRRGAPGGRT